MGTLAEENSTSCLVRPNILDVDVVVCSWECECGYRSLEEREDADAYERVLSSLNIVFSRFPCEQAIS